MDCGGEERPGTDRVGDVVSEERSDASFCNIEVVPVPSPLGLPPPPPPPPPPELGIRVMPAMPDNHSVANFHRTMSR